MATDTPGLIAWVDRQLGRLAGLFAVVGALAVVALMALTVVAVAWRYLLNDPIFGIEDLSIVTLTIVAGASVAYGARHGAHVSVDIISHLLSRRARYVSDLVMRLSAIFICALAAWSLMVKACGMEKACITANFSIVHRPYYYFLGVAMGFYALVLLVRLIAGRDGAGR